MQFNQELEQYSNKLRVRVCGLLLENSKLLLLKHEGIGKEGHLWSPPGGGMEAGEDAITCLKREFREETNLEIESNTYLFTNEYMDDRHHAIELFFSVRRISGTLKLGYDPELSRENQLLSAAQFFSDSELLEIDECRKHNAFRFCDRPMDILQLKGFHYFKNI